MDGTGEGWPRHTRWPGNTLSSSLCIISASRPLPLCSSPSRFRHLLLCRETFFVDLPRCLPFSVCDLSFSVELPLHRISLSFSFSVELPLRRIFVVASHF
ncbi:hypothetical protein ACLOJK_033658 [Asimina triloba]